MNARVTMMISIVVLVLVTCSLLYLTYACTCPSAGICYDCQDGVGFCRAGHALLYWYAFGCSGYCGYKCTNDVMTRTCSSYYPAIVNSVTVGSVITNGNDLLSFCRGDLCNDASFSCAAAAAASTTTPSPNVMASYCYDCPDGIGQCSSGNPNMNWYLVQCNGYCGYRCTNGVMTRTCSSYYSSLNNSVNVGQLVTSGSDNFYFYFCSGNACNSGAFSCAATATAAATTTPTTTSTTKATTMTTTTPSTTTTTPPPMLLCYNCQDGDGQCSFGNPYLNRYLAPCNGYCGFKCSSGVMTRTCSSSYPSLNFAGNAGQVFLIGNDIFYFCIGNACNNGFFSCPAWTTASATTTTTPITTTTTTTTTPMTTTTTPTTTTTTPTTTTTTPTTTTTTPTTTTTTPTTTTTTPTTTTTTPTTTTTTPMTTTTTTTTTPTTTTTATTTPTTTPKTTTTTPTTTTSTTTTTTPTTTPTTTTTTPSTTTTTRRTTPTTTTTTTPTTTMTTTASTLSLCYDCQDGVEYCTANNPNLNSYLVACNGYCGYSCTNGAMSRICSSSYPALNYAANLGQVISYGSDIVYLCPDDMCNGDSFSCASAAMSTTPLPTVASYCYQCSQWFPTCMSSSPLFYTNILPCKGYCGYKCLPGDPNPQRVCSYNYYLPNFVLDTTFNFGGSVFLFCSGPICNSGMMSC